MAFQQSDLDTIRSCIASGILETRFADGRLTRFQSLADMMKAEQRIAVAVARASGSGPRRCTPGYRDGL